MEEKKVNKPKSPSMPSSSKSFSTSKNVKPMTSYNKTVETPSEITGVEKITQNTVEPKNLKKFFAILTAVVLSLLVGIAFVFIIINPVPTRPSDISLNFKVSSNISINGVDLDTTRKAMPGDVIDYSFVLSTSRNEETTGEDLDVFLRIKTSVVVDDNYYPGVVSLIFTDDSKWLQGGDGYYYLTKTDFDDGLLSPNEEIRIIRNMEIDKSIGNEFAGKTIKIVFEAEVLQAQYQAIDELWVTAPYEWSSQYKYLTW